MDPDYKEVRPEENASDLIKIFKGKDAYIRHLDFGGENGLLCKRLKDSAWDSLSYDPFIEPDVDLNELGHFNFITAYEVFEHVPDVNNLTRHSRNQNSLYSLSLSSVLTNARGIGHESVR